jgi:hypothetical protein
MFRVENSPPILGKGIPSLSFLKGLFIKTLMPDISYRHQCRKKYSTDVTFEL